MSARGHLQQAGTWYAANAVEHDARPQLLGELDVDVCVIGAGLAGLTAAREIAKRGWSVVVLEADRIGGAASGRNTGFVIPGFAIDLPSIAKRVGPDDARQLWALSERGVDYVRETIGSLRMSAAALTPGGWLHVSKAADEDDRRAYVETLVQDYGVAAVAHWPRERVRSVLKSPLYFGAVHYERGFSIHPLNYALGLAEAAEAAGARIFEHSPAMTFDPAGVRKRIATPKGRVRAAHVILAGNVQGDRLLPAMAGTLIPITTYVIVTAPLGERLAAVVNTKATVSDTELANNHYRIVDGDRLMWSGRSTVWAGDPSRYVDALLADLARTYPQLGPAEAQFAWRGTLGNPMHRMPQIGEVMPGVWALSGFGGHGLNTTAMGGELIARAVTDGDSTWRLFAPFHLVWAGGFVGRAIAQAYSWTFDKRERLASWQAQRQAGGGAVAMMPALAFPTPPEINGEGASGEEAAEPRIEKKSPGGEGGRATENRPGGPSETAAKVAPRQGRSHNRRRRTAKADAPTQQPATEAATDGGET